MSRRGVSLVEVLVVSAILSSSILGILGLIHFSTRGTVLNDKQLLASQLAANMAERWRLLPAERLDALFGDGTGAEEVVEADELLNPAGSLSSAALRKQGFRRRVYYARSEGVKPPLLTCVVEWEVAGSRPRAVRVGEVVGSGVPGAPGAPVSGVPASASAVDAPSELVFARARSLDQASGAPRYPWPGSALPPGTGALLEILRRRVPPPGLYAYDAERFDVSPGRVLTLLTLDHPEHGRFFLLKEDFGPPDADPTSSFLQGAPVRPPELRLLLRLPSEAGAGPAVVGRQWAKLVAGADRLYVFRADADAGGILLDQGQRVWISSLEHPWKPGGEASYEASVAAAAAAAGLGEERGEGAVLAQWVSGRLKL